MLNNLSNLKISNPSGNDRFKRKVYTKFDEVRTHFFQPIYAWKAVQVTESNLTHLDIWGTTLKLSILRTFLVRETTVLV